MVTDIVIRPYVGVGTIDFGMTSDEVEDLLGPPEARFQRFPPLQEWLYQDSSIRLMFDAESRFEFAEFFEPVVATVEGTNLTGSHSALVNDLVSRGYSLTENGSITICEALGVQVGRDAPNQDNINGSGAFRRGYWE